MHGLHKEGTHIVDAMTGEIFDTIEQTKSHLWVTLLNQHWSVKR